jgi:hypothetical protein
MAIAGTVPLTFEKKNEADPDHGRRRDGESDTPGLAVKVLSDTHAHNQPEFPLYKQRTGYIRSA